jgi:hypothetical protein
MSSLGLTTLKRKNLLIVVTLGGIGSYYASLALYFIAFLPSYKLCDNKVQATPLREKGYIYEITMNLGRHIRSRSLVRDRLRQAEMLSLNKR